MSILLVGVTSRVTLYMYNNSIISLNDGTGLAHNTFCIQEAVGTFYCHSPYRVICFAS